MRRILISISTGMAVLLLTVSAFAAGIGFGVKTNLVDVAASGSESTATNGSETETSTTSAVVGNDEWIGSYYLELTLGDENQFAIGYEAIPGSADVSDKAHTRSDTEKSKTSDVTQNTATRTFKADAEVDNFSVIYTEIPLGSVIYVRAGISSITVNTKEVASSNGGNYGNADLDGIQWGIGLKGLAYDRFRWKLGYEVNDFDSLNLVSTGNSVTAETNRLRADLDTSAVNFGVGVQF